MKRYQGVVVRVGYYAHERDDDSVTVRLADGTLIDAYRFQVDELGPQECEDWTNDDNRRRAS